MKNSHSRLSLAVFLLFLKRSKIGKCAKIAGWFLKLNIFPYIRLYVKEGDKREVFYVEV